MRFSLDFLREFVEIDIRPSELARRLTLAGMEVISLKPFAGDWIFEAEITANRPDLLSIWGLSYEVAALLGKKVRLKIQPSLATPSRNSLPIYIEEKQYVPFYVGRLITGVKVKRSPLWLRKRLASVGIEEVNNVVDITNYCLFKWGAPLHAFDADKIEKGVWVRYARTDESLLCLDEKERKLLPQDLVIADNRRLLAIAGVIGGKDSEISAHTQSVFLEAAVFDPLLIRRTSRRLGISTEASYRFERQVFPFNTERASQEAAALICRLGEGKLTQSRTMGKAGSQRKKSIILSPGALNTYLDTNLKPAHIASILRRLGCEVKPAKKDRLLVKLPLHRRDLSIEVDLFEEIARIYGYDNIPSRLSFINNSAPLSETVEFKRRLKKISAQAGFREIVSFSLISESEAKGLNRGRLIKVINPLRSGENILRPQLLEGILRTFTYNLDQFQNNLEFFEIADVYIRQKEEIKEEAHYVLGCLGESQDDLLHFKGRVLTILRALGIETIQFLPTESDNFLSAAMLKSKNYSLGTIGVVEGVGSKKDKRTKAFVFEVALEALKKASGPARFRPFSRFPAVKRDISLALRQECQFSEIEPKLREVGGEMLVEIATVDFYTGSNLPAGYRSITLRFYYQLPQRTLTAEEVDSQHQKIRQILANSPGVILR